MSESDIAIESPFSIGKRPIDSIETFKDLLLMHIPLQKSLTQAELVDLIGRDPGDLTLDGLTIFIDQKLQKTAEVRKYNKNLDQLLLDDEKAKLILTGSEKKSIDIARELSNKSTIPWTSDKKPRIDEKTEKIYASLQAMIESKKYGEASAYCLQIARSMWGKHEKRIKEIIEDDRKHPRQAEEKRKFGIQPDETYWSQDIQRYLRWATVLAKAV